MKVFSTDLRLYATAYIVAETQEEADKIARDLAGSTLEMPDGYCGDGLEVWGGSFNIDMPELSLSPAMTIAPLAEQEIAFDEADELDDEAEADEDSDYDDQGNLKAGVDN
jgi:hypothetical protein